MAAPAERRRGDVVVAEQAADLLGDVRHADQIGTPRRHADPAWPLDGDLQTAQIFDHVGLGDVRAEQGIDAVRLQLDGARLGDVVEHVDDAVHDLTGAQQLDELAGAVHGRERQQRIDVLFKLAGGPPCTCRVQGPSGGWRCR